MIFYNLYNSTIFKFFLLLFSLAPFLCSAQLSSECQLDIGVNLGGLADFGTELPFVDLMKNCRTWYTRDGGNPDAPFDSEHTSDLSYRADGYPTHAPQVIPESEFPQIPTTIWAITTGWPIGEYTLLWDGTGKLDFWGSYENLEEQELGRITFDMLDPFEGVVEMMITESDIDDPIRNIRLLMPGSESTYESQPFNPIFLEKLSSFQTVRFMDWGQTNNWGQKSPYVWDDPSLFDWADRSQMDHYTWAYEKGIPYEMMIQLMNDFDLDGWVCVPYKANDNYMSNMADLFRDQLEVDRHLTVEYSNENWNWIFGQAQWLNEYGCIQQGLDWPEGLAPYVQNCLDHFTNSFEGQLDRITRVVGAFTGWLDITQRITENLEPASFDAIAATFYFGFSDEGEAILDGLGEHATIEDVALHAREGMVQNLAYIQGHKNEIADVFNVPLVFYEGGQHLTPQPFGETPTYAQALEDVQRDTSMYNMYNEWFDQLRTMQEGDDPLQLMHFSFVSDRSARYGSWGMLETMDQDTALIPAPKYSSILENMAPAECLTVSESDELEEKFSDVNFDLFPNPTRDHIIIKTKNNIDNGVLNIFNTNGQKVLSQEISRLPAGQSLRIRIAHLSYGLYHAQFIKENKASSDMKFFKSE